MIVNLGTKKQNPVNSNPHRFDEKKLFSIEELIGSKLLERSASLLPIPAQKAICCADPTEQEASHAAATI